MAKRYSCKELRPAQRRNQQYSYLDPLGVGPIRETRSQGTAASKALDPSPALATKRIGPKTRESARINTTSKEKTIPAGETSPIPMPPESTKSTNDHSEQSKKTIEPEDITMDDEDALLMDPAENQQERKNLLSLRQSFKKNRCNLARVNSHLDFINQCMHNEKTPKGLTVNVHCNALLADLTTIKQKFKDTKEEAEYEFTESLNMHYKSVKKTLEKELTELERHIETEQTRATDAELKIHQEMMSKTRENIEKQEKRLEERKRKKIEVLSHPKEKKPRESKDYDSSKSRYNNNPKGAPRPRRSDYRQRNYPKPNKPQSSITVNSTEMTTIQTKATPPQPLMQNPSPYQQGPLPTPQPQAPQLSSIISMLGQLLQQPNAMQQQPPSLLPHTPCSVGQQPPALQVPQMSTVFGQPPQLSGYGHQGFH